MYGLIRDALRQRLESEGPIRVAIAGAGFMASALCHHITASAAGMTVAAIYCRDAAQGVEALTKAGVADLTLANDKSTFDRAIRAGRSVVTSTSSLLAASDHVDAIVDATGSVDFGCSLAIDSIANGKHLVLLNSELDATVGPILGRMATEAGVVYTSADGDQPAAQVELYHFARTAGMIPLMLGSIKGLHDVSRNPSTQAAFARRWRQNARMVTSFADGTKMSMEQAVVANATGFGLQQRGMMGVHHSGHVDGLTDVYDYAELHSLGGIVDYVVGAIPGPGVYCIAEAAEEYEHHFLELFKLGDGPMYCLYRPYHLCHLEVPVSVARAVLFGSATAAPKGPPIVGVGTVAKRDLAAGTRLDGIGGFDTYGIAVTHEDMARDGLLPMGAAESCVLTRSLRQGELVTWSEVDLPSPRAVDRLLALQSSTF